MKMNCYQYKNKKYLPFERSLYGKRVKPSLDCENLYRRLFRQKRKELKTAVLHGFQTFFLWPARRGSNSQSSESESDALSNYATCGNVDFSMFLTN